MLKQPTSVPTPKILLNIYCPGQWVLKVNVLETATSNDIKKFIKNKDVELLYNGLKLTRQYNFKFYGLRNEDVLVVVPKNTDIKAIPSSWENISQDEDVFRERISSVINPRISEEAGRIRDLQLFKIENKPNVFRKLLAFYQQEPAPKPEKPTKTFVPNQADKPSSEPLPCFWSSAPTTFKQPEKIPPVPFSTLKDEEISLTDNN